MFLFISKTFINMIVFITCVFSHLTFAIKFDIIGGFAFYVVIMVALQINRCTVYFTSFLAQTWVQIRKP